MRQLMFASANCGRALVAWPPESMVATQVVRSMELYFGSAATTAAAVLSAGLATSARIALPMAGVSVAADCVKNARVTSLICTGNSYRPTFESASASDVIALSARGTEECPPRFVT